MDFTRFTGRESLNHQLSLTAGEGSSSGKDELSRYNTDYRIKFFMKDALKWRKISHFWLYFRKNVSYIVSSPPPSLPTYQI